MIKWFKNRLSINEVDPPERPSEKDEFEMSIRVEEALAATAAAAKLVQAHADEAQRLFGMIRREIAITKVGEADPG